ncbi:MAG TPA: Spy/CpxP family protein refolding chaperone [Candidatus Binataceae bacterium]|nr:Spy/CpxP family protein refolding chaperone [Candidatus Binataceae bacterium]
MISFVKHPAARAASVAATLLGAVVFVTPSFAAGNSQDAQPKTNMVLASASSEKAVRTEAPGPAAVEAHIKELRTKLKITEAEEPQWNNLCQVMRDNAQAMLDLEKQRAADAQSMNAVDVIKSYEQVIEAHEDGMKKFVPAFEAFYNTLSDSQKATADAMFRSKARASARETAQK